MISVKNLFSKAFSKNSIYLGDGIKNGSRTKQVDYLSKLNSSGIATVCGTFVNLCVNVIEDRVLFFKEDSKIYAQCESSRDSSREYHVLFDKNTLDLNYFVTEDGIEIKEDFEGIPHWSLFAPLFYILKNDTTYSEEFSNEFNKLFEEFKSKKTLSKTPSLFKYCDYMYLSKSMYTNDAVEQTFEIPDVLKLEDVKPVITKVKKEPTTKKKSTKKKEVKSFEGYELEWDRELTEDEKLRIPKFELDVDVLVPAYIIPNAKVIKGQHNSVYPIRNVLYYGEAASGKSTASRILSKMLGLPYYSFDISKNVDETIITAGAEVDKGTLTYNYSEVVQAVEHGGLLELREIYTMSPGVQVFLNGLLEEGVLRLPNGKLIKRHPNCIIVGTTNVDYESCQNFDKSTDDRFQIQYMVEPMPKEQIIQVVMNKSGNDDKVLVDKLYDTYIKLRVAIEKEMMDSVATMRKLIEWAIHCKYMDTVSASKMTILSGITKDKREQDNFLNKIILNTFK